MRPLQRFCVFLLNNPGPVKRWPSDIPQSARASAVGSGYAVPIDTTLKNGQHNFSPKHYELTHAGRVFATVWQKGESDQ